MTNKKSPQQDAEADFSGYFQKDSKPLSQKKEQTQSALQELPTVTLNTKRIKKLILILLVLAIAQFVYFYYTQKNKNPGIPEGYQIILEDRKPPSVVPIQK